MANDSIWCFLDDGYPEKIFPYENSSDRLISAAYGLKKGTYNWDSKRYMYILKDDNNITRCDIDDFSCESAYEGVWNLMEGGLEHTCAINDENEIHCWGKNSYGQIGTDEDYFQKSIAEVITEPRQSWVSLSAGNQNTCAIDNHGELYCWGLNLAISYRPVRISPENSWKEIIRSNNKSATCAINSDDSLWCWGHGSYGQLGNGDEFSRKYPEKVVAGDPDADVQTWKDVKFYGYRVCGIKTDNSLWCWGRNDYGQIGNGDQENQLLPVQVIAGNPANESQTWKEFFLETQYTCGIKSDQSLWCWGYNYYGQLAITDDQGDYIETVVNPSKILTEGVEPQTWSKLFPSKEIMCGIKTDNTLWCWGQEDKTYYYDENSVRTYIPIGYLGLGEAVTPDYETSSYRYFYTPNQVGRDTWQKVFFEQYHTCGIKLDGSLHCWGKEGRTYYYDENSDRVYFSLGYLGVATPKGFTNSSAYFIEPTLVDAGSWKEYDYQNSRSCGIKTDDTLWCWGKEDRYKLVENGIDVYYPMGNLGVGDAVPTIYDNGKRYYNSPAQVGTDTWDKIYLEYTNSYGIKKDGTLWGFGENNGYMLYANGEKGRTVPGQIGTDTWHSMTIKTDGYMKSYYFLRSDDTLWSMGNNRNGLAGVGDADVAKRDFAQILTGTGDETWGSIGKVNEFKFHSTCAIKQDGSLWCWGANYQKNDGHYFIGVPVSSAAPKRVELP